MSDDANCQIIETKFNYKSITCEKIPELFLDKLVAKKHFGKYGKISRFILRPNRLCCTVDYERVEDAANALRNGTLFNGQEFNIRYSLHEVGHVQNTEEWVDPDVQAELDIMGNHARRMPASIPKLPPLHTNQMAASRSARQKVIKNHNPEPAAAPPPIQRAVPHSVRAELEAIIRKPAQTDEEKYRILDARDKLIRLTTVRTTDIRKVVSIKGTCPDMCPEKERFMREFQHQVSTFEMEEGGNRSEMNHNIAIKEYSRSSADQEVPLAHELRPEPALRMTMQYLMHSIMGLCDIADLNIGDWFHFVWDRTRGIRKDITQQELCSTGTVELVEQCARFHIHCAARLVAEDPSVFDQKINTENLTKCLQTLKYMYNDLRVKGIRCRNEPEFRGFIVLLNLNDANFLWELQDLPEEIQNSTEVRSAIAFYKCMESNNYVKFFNLVKRTSYMNACILLRYFTQVRLKATKMIIKAYNWPRHSVSLPLGHLIKILGFENEDAALDFFSFYGLQCDVEAVRLDKKAFEQPDVPVLMDRAFEIVESKREVGVGEAVCGRPLDPPSIFENHEPHNSFDVNGYLRYESFSAEDQLKDEIVSKTPPSTTIQTDKIFKIPVASPPMTPKQKLKSLFSNTSPKDDSDFKPITHPSLPTISTASESIFNKESFNPPISSSISSSIFKIPMPAPPVQEPTAPSISIFGSSSSFQPTATEKKSSIFGGSKNNFEEPTKPSSTNIFATSTQSFANDNIFQHFNAKPLEFNLIQPQIKQRQQETRRQDQEEEHKKKRLLLEQQEIARRKEIEELQRQIQILEEKKMRAHLEEKARRDTITKIKEKSQEILIQLLDEVQNENLRQIATTELLNYQFIEKLTEDIISEYILEHIMQIHSEELTKLQRDQTLLFKYFHTWRELTEKRKAQRNLVATFPIWMTTNTLDEQAEKIAHPQQTENMQMIKRYRLGHPCDFRALLGDDDLDCPINIVSCLMKNFKKSHNQLPTGFLKRRKYFKLLISLPGEREELPGLNSYASNWLDKNVDESTTTSGEFICTCQGDLALCVRKISSIQPVNEKYERVRRECDHAGALLFMMAPGNIQNSRKRLHHLLKLTKNHQAIPVAVLMYNASTITNTFHYDLDVESLVAGGKISTFQAFPTSDHNMKIDFQKSLRFLAQNENYTCPLEAQSIQGFLNTSLGDELWQKLQTSWTMNPSFRKICSTPKFLIEIYNLGIQNLIQIIDEDFEDYIEFPEELRQFVPSAKFDIPVDLEQFPNDWKNIDRVKKLIDFLKKLKLPTLASDEEIPRDIDDLELWLLNYTSLCIPNEDDLATKAGYNSIKCLINELNSVSLQDLPVDQRLDWISWLPIVREIALAIMNHIWMDRCDKIPREVIYNRDELREFQSEPWWLRSNPVKSVKMITEEEEEQENLQEDDEPGLDIDSIIARAEKVSAIADDKLKQLQDEIKETTADPNLTRQLDETLYNFEVNEKCASFEGTSKVFTNEDEDDSLDQPPVCKKFKENPEQEEIENAMERALAVLKKTDILLDRHLRPLQELQLYKQDYS